METIDENEGNFEDQRRSFMESHQEQSEKKKERMEIGDNRVEVDRVLWIPLMRVRETLGSH